MVVNTTFNNMSVLWWWSVLLVAETRVPGKAIDLQVIDKNYHMLYRIHLVWAGFELTMLVVMDAACIGSCKSIYSTITTAPKI